MGVFVVRAHSEDQTVTWDQHMIVAGALAWCIGFLEAVGHDVSDRPFVQVATQPRFVYLGSRVSEPAPDKPLRAQFNCSTCGEQWDWTDGDGETEVHCACGERMTFKPPSLVHLPGRTS